MQMVGRSGTSQGQIRICFSYCLDLFWMSFSSGFECSLLNASLQSHFDAFRCLDNDLAMFWSN